MFLRKKLPVRKLVVLAGCLRGLQKVSGAQPARLVGSAYSIDPAINDDEDARFPDVRIYAIGDIEYLVPQKTEWKDGLVSQATVYLNKAEKILERPFSAEGAPTRIVTEMKRSTDIDPDVFASLLTIINERYKPKPGYKVHIVKPSPR